MVCLGNKHGMKIGEPGFPVAAAECGRRVVGTSFKVGDHDFTKFSMIPSAVLQNHIPEDVASSWSCGQVFVTLKEGAFEPSSPMRHMAELYSILDNQHSDKKALLVYTDGGPDHRVTYMSVQVSLIALFLKLDLDFLCAERTAPCHSWRNPVERITSTLNLGLQCIELMREKMDDDFKTEAKKCNNLKALRAVASRKPDFSSTVCDSVSHTKVLLTQTIRSTP